MTAPPPDTLDILSRGRSTARTHRRDASGSPPATLDRNLLIKGRLCDDSPLANAVGYGCWHVARLLVARGARIGSLWEAAGLGDRARVDEFLAADPPPTSSDIDEAFYQACHGGQRRIAEYLLAQGADINASPGYAHHQTALQVADAADTRRQILVDWLKERGAAEG